METSDNTEDNGFFNNKHHPFCFTAGKVSMKEMEDHHHTQIYRPVCTNNQFSEAVITQSI